jgi:hypothetical protein
LLARYARSTQISRIDAISSHPYRNNFVVPTKNEQKRNNLHRGKFNLNFIQLQWLFHLLSCIDFFCCQCVSIGPETANYYTIETEKRAAAVVAA